MLHRAILQSHPHGVFAAFGRRSVAASKHARVLTHNVRCFATALDTIPNGGLQPQATGLQSLGQRGGLLPKPEVFDEKLKPGFRGGKALFVFFLCNALPLGALLYYLQEKREERTQLCLSALPAAAEDVVAEALRVVRTTPVCFLLRQQDGTGSAYGGVLRVDVHPPEAVAYTAPTEPLPLLPQLERNVLTDIFEAPPIAGLGFIHFALSRSSAAAVQAGHRRASLLYSSATREAYCIVSGQVSVLTDPDLRRRYWKGMWSFSFLEGRTADSAEQSPWMNNDYVLLRLAVDEVTLRAMVDGPERWEHRCARRRPAPASLQERGDGVQALQWTLTTPEGE